VHESGELAYRLAANLLSLLKESGNEALDRFGCSVGWVLTIAAVLVGARQSWAQVTTGELDAVVRRGDWGGAGGWGLRCW